MVSFFSGVSGGRRAKEEFNYACSVLVCCAEPEKKLIFAGSNCRCEEV